MSVTLFADKTSVTAKAIFVGQRIHLRTLQFTERLAGNPLVVTAGNNGCAVIFRYGVVVVFGLSGVEEAAFLRQMENFVVEPFAEVQAESLRLQASSEEEHLENSNVYLRNFNVERLQLIADVLAKSVVLAHYEAATANSFDRIEPLAGRLQMGGKGTSEGRELLRQIGDILSIQSKMVGRVEIGEKPELLWEYPELEKLYMRLEDEYEVHDRHVALERKFALISRTVNTLLDLLHHNRSLRVEWYIVILILVDIVISIIDKVL